MTRVDDGIPAIRSKNVKSILLLDDRMRKLQQKIATKEAEIETLKKQLAQLRIMRTTKNGQLRGGQQQELARARARRAVALMPEFGEPQPGGKNPISTIPLIP